MNVGGVMDFIDETNLAVKRINNYIRKTPLDYSQFLSNEGKNNTFLKLENFQLTGSFKIRGATNKILSLKDIERSKGIITASSGNHGAAFAYIINRLKIPGTIFLPETASKTKIDSLKRYGVRLEFHGTDCVATEKYARKIAEEQGLTFISPYNDPKIIAGQATVGFELMEQAESIDVVLVPVGGGGLISGIAGYLKSINNGVKIVGCQPLNSPVMYESIKQGKIVSMDSLATISDGTAGGIEENSITFEYCKKFVDDFKLVSETEIKQSIKLMLKHHHMLVEGAAALTISSLLKFKEEFHDQNVILIVSGAKISLENLKEIVC